MSTINQVEVENKIYDIEDKQAREDLKNKYAKKTDIPTNISELNNDSGFLKEIPEEYAKKTDIPSIDGLATEEYVDDAISNINIPDVDRARIEKTSSDTSVSLEPNKLYVFPEMTSLEISLGGTVNTSIVQEYTFRFTSGTTATTLILPENIKGEITIEANKIYEVSIVDNLLLSQSWGVN